MKQTEIRRPMAMALAFIALISLAGWLSAVFPAAARAETAMSKSGTMYTKNKIKMFAKPSTDSKVLCRIPKGTALAVESAKKGWYAVRYDGKSGFVRRNKMSAKAPGTPGDDDATPAPSSTPEPTPPEEPAPTPQTTPEPTPPQTTPDPPEESTPDPDTTPETTPPQNTPDPTRKPGERVSQIDAVMDIEDDSETGEDRDNSGLRNLDRSRNKARDWSGQIVLGEGGMQIPQLFQTDFREVVCVYNGSKRSVSTSGCSVTCLSMIIAYKTGNTSQSPYTLFRDACQRGMYRGKGLSRSALAELAASYAIKGQWRSLDKEGILQCLREEKPVIAHMGPGIFTKGGHYVVLRGLTEDGMVLVNDPASPERSRRAYPAELFVAESKPGSAFYVCEGVNQEVLAALSTPTPEPTIEPTPEATIEPTPEPTIEPTPEATIEPTPEGLTA